MQTPPVAETAELKASPHFVRTLRLAHLANGRFRALTSRSTAARRFSRSDAFRRTSIFSLEMARASGTTIAAEIDRLFEDTHQSFVALAHELAQFPLRPRAPCVLGNRQRIGTARRGLTAGGRRPRTQKSPVGSRGAFA